MGLVLVLALSGCSDEPKPGDDYLDGIDLTAPEIVEACDEDKDGVVTEEEFLKCEVAATGSSTGNGNTVDTNGTVLGGSSSDADANVAAAPLGDVRATGPGIDITFDADSGVAIIKADGETSYMDTDGFMYASVDGAWSKIKFVGEGSFGASQYPELAEADYLNPDAPSGIPVADMPYKALYANVTQKYTPVSTKCASGAECKEITTDEGGILRYDSTLRLVEAVLQGNVVTFTHGEYDVAAPAANEVSIPNIPGMPAGFDPSQFMQ